LGGGEGGVARDRAEAGNWLAKLGDTRDPITTCDAMHFCLVPAGPFVLGSQKAQDEQAYDDELFGQEHDIPYDYLIGRYPITNAHYAEFVRDPGGYANRLYWPEAEAAGVWCAGRVFRNVYFYDDQRQLKKRPENERGEGATGPHDFGEPFNLPNHPVVGICWYEMLAFTRWLTAQWRDRLPDGWRVVLPSEVEWEKAARGGLWLPAELAVAAGPLEAALARRGLALPVQNPNPARRFAYNDDPADDVADPERMNFDETKLNATSAAGCFVAGASPYGCQDMNGNVWEWTRSLWGEGSDAKFNYPYDNIDERERLDASVETRRVLRGGAFFYFDGDARCAIRFRVNPDFGFAYDGFRVVVRVCSS